MGSGGKSEGAGRWKVDGETEYKERRENRPNLRKKQTSDFTWRFNFIGLWNEKKKNKSL